MRLSRMWVSHRIGGTLQCNHCIGGEDMPLEHIGEGRRHLGSGTTSRGSHSMIP